MSWINVTKSNPCPICHKTDWCSVTDDGRFCFCHRVKSDDARPSGWLHRLNDHAQPAARASSPRPANQTLPGLCADRGESAPIQPTDFAGEHFAALPTGNIQTRLCRYLARELGLSADALLELDLRWDAKAHAAAFPMMDADGNVTGIRYRQLKTGRKWSLKGSKDGLFYSASAITITPSKELVVCEGPTDTAAAIALGLPAVGRSSCMTGAAHIKELIRRYRYSSVTIAADRDEPKTRPDGSKWNPGMDGAKRLAADLHMPTRIILPPPKFKDLRAWYEKGGMTANDFAIAQASAKWLMVES